MHGNLNQMNLWSPFNIIAADYDSIIHCMVVAFGSNDTSISYIPGARDVSGLKCEARGI